MLFLCRNWTCPACGLRNLGDASDCVRCTMSRPAVLSRPPVSKPGGWACTACSSSNEFGASACAVCGSVSPFGRPVVVPPPLPRLPCLNKPCAAFAASTVSHLCVCVLCFTPSPFLQGDACAAVLCSRCFQLILARDDDPLPWLLDTYIRQASMGCGLSTCHNRWCKTGGGLIVANPADVGGWAKSLLPASHTVGTAEACYYVCVGSPFRTFGGEAAIVVGTAVPASNTTAATGTARPTATAAKGAKRKSDKDKIAGAFF